MTLAQVNLWGKTIGAVRWEISKKVGVFEYSPAFQKSDIQISPIHMPLSSEIYSFPNLSWDSFRGLPGLLADSLPDRFGNALINAWLSKQGRSPESFNPVERLCYIGKRGMGALEYEPTLGPKGTPSDNLDVEALVSLAGEILSQRDRIKGSLEDDKKENTLQDILRVGTSAGGARAKAIIAWNPKTNEVRSGQSATQPGFHHWLLKFDGVTSNKDKELEDPQGFGRIEFAYANMAKKAGINMMESRLLEENGRAHFMIRRFDRDSEGKKLHMQTLGALAHFDFNQAGGHSYEQAFQILRKLDLSIESLEELFRRMTFNIVARNQDDHVKNIAFLMNKSGDWSLAPAYDIVYNYNPEGPWTSAHQMSMNGKRDGFTIQDFVECGKSVSLKRGLSLEILKEVQEVVRQWPDFAEQAGVPSERARGVGQMHRVQLL